MSTCDYGKNEAEIVIKIPEGVSFDMVIPVPVGQKRLVKRGYNQSEFMARQFLRRWADADRESEFDPTCPKLETHILGRSRETAMLRSMNPEERVYGADTVDVVLENPYRLTDEVFGIGFRKADSIAAKIGIAPDDAFRIKSGIKFTLSWFAGEGNTYLPEEMLCEKAGALLEQPRELVAGHLEQMAFFGDVHIDASRTRTT